MDNYNLYRFDNMTYEEYQKSGGGTYDGTVTPLMQSIVDHAANNQGSYPCTPDMCAQWVTGIYQAAGAPTILMGMPSICGTTIKIPAIPAWKIFRREPLCAAVDTEVWEAFMVM